MAQLCPQTPLSLFVTSEDSQGHSGGIQIEISSTWAKSCLVGPRYITFTWTVKKTLLPRIPPFFCVYSLPQNSFTMPLPSSGHIYFLNYSGFWASHRNIFQAHLVP
jgi:hypothetical protein